MKVFLLLAICFVCVQGHGRMIEPAARNCMWRYGFSNPTNTDDTALYCGGFQNQVKQGGKCGACGDPWQGPRLHEAGGRYANGIIARTYKQGQVIEVKVELTASHLGWMEFSLCPWNNPKEPVSQECLDAGVLQLADGSGSKVYIDNTKKMINVRLRLPSDVSCTQCVLQWWYYAGNNWNCHAGQCCTGCGPQEQFKNCADVAITASGNTGNTKTNPPRTSASTTTTRPTTRTTTAARTTRPRSTTRIPRTTTSTTTTRAARRTTRGKKTGCRAVKGPWPMAGMDAWCQANCARKFCPQFRCTCD